MCTNSKGANEQTLKTELRVYRGKDTHTGLRLGLVENRGSKKKDS